MVGSTSKRDKISISCKCGIMVFGNSTLNANANLILHQKGKRHTDIIEFEILSGAKLTKKEVKE